MKSLLSALLALALSILPLSGALNAFAAPPAETLPKEDLPNYFVFEDGTWWDYVNYIEYSGSYDIDEDLIAEDEEDATYRVEDTSCQIYNCFVHTSSNFSASYYVQEDNIYMYMVNGYTIEDDLLVLSFDGIVGDISDLRGALLGYSDLTNITAQMECAVSYDSAGELNGYSGGFLEHTCIYTFEEAYQPDVRYQTTEYYIEYVGLVESETRYYEDNDWQYTLSTVLQDSSIEPKDTEEEQEVEVELSEETEEVEDGEEESAAGAAVDSELLKQNLEDYIDFDDDTWWEYETELEDYTNGSTDTSRKVDFNGEDGTDSYIEDNIAYYTSIDGDELSQDYIQIDLNGFEQSIAEEDYSAFGFDETVWGEMSSMSIACEYDFDDSSSFELSDGEEYEEAALLETCTLEAELDAGNTIKMLLEDNYLKGLGGAEAMVRFYFDGTLILQSTITLMSSSLLEEAAFSDLDVEDNNYPAIDYLYEAGVISGYDDGSFKPENTVNRAELLKILVEGLGISPDADVYKNCFPDVTADWYAKYVCYAKEEGWVGGYPDGNFRPADPVNKVEALKMLLNSQGVETASEFASSFEDVDEDDWFEPYVVAAEELGILEEDGKFFSPDGERDRAGICENLYRLLVY